MWAFLALLFISVGVRGETEAPSWLSMEALGQQQCARWEGRAFTGCQASAAECKESCDARIAVPLTDETQWVCPSEAEPIICCCPKS
ncbi:MAG: hypothetical protein H6617_02290 [Bdellovibrionaceae bacterium]|nr:hypothetical protein [Bdellovibrionales bacterium]MCB9253491.1 hypothetical protein [Pseudobdellovibrionaceae bacterium]